jgi:RecB family exonuclease
MIDAAARRAAVAAALGEHAPAACAGHIDGAAFVDGFVALSIAADRQGVETPALALAAAESDEATSMAARVLIAERAYRANVTEGASDQEPEWAPGWAIELICGLLAAAIAADDEIVVRWLASPAVGLDIAYIRAARIASGEASLTLALGQSLNSFRTREARERAVLAVKALRVVTGALEREGATLAKIVRSAVGAAQALCAPSAQPISDAFVRAAAAADAVWAAAGRAPEVGARVRVIIEAMQRTRSGSAPIPLAAFSLLADPLERARIRPIDGEASAARPTAQSIGEIAAWGWPTPEPPRPVIAPPMTFSASRLNAFVQCGRRWFFEYLCDAVEDRGSIYATYGKVVHEALEHLHRDVREPAAVDRDALLDDLMRQLDAAFGRSRSEFASQFEYEVARLQARRVAPKYVTWLVTRAAAAPMEIVEVESVNRLRAGGHDFVGFIDRVDRPIGGGPVTIFDYKTGRVPDDPRAYLEAVRSGDEAQLALYYFMRRARGDAVASMALISVRDPRDDVRVLALDIVEAGQEASRGRAGAAACPRAVLDDSLAALVKRCDVLTGEGLPHFNAGADPPCRFCAYAAACRERPPEPESIFAR